MQCIAQHAHHRALRAAAAACSLLLQRLPGHKDSCLTCVALVDEEESKAGLTSRLFSSGLDGALVEWDVEQRRAGPAADSLGGAVWQLAPEPGACIKPGTPHPACLQLLVCIAPLHCAPAACGVTSRLLHFFSWGPLEPTSPFCPPFPPGLLQAALHASLPPVTTAAPAYSRQMRAWLA
jgi:hypothetical protein